MKQKIFISYFSKTDNKKMKMLSDEIEKLNLFIPIIIANRRKALMPLYEKVTSGIKECDIFIPILTRNSINSQWVNQEIGYAQAIERKIIPIVEEEIIDLLKGFIHKQGDLPYKYPGFENNTRKESLRFKKCIKLLLADIHPTKRDKSKLIKLRNRTTLFLVSNNNLRQLPDKPTRILLGYTTRDIEVISQSEFDKYTLIKPIPSIKFASLVKYGESIYAVFGNSIRLIPNFYTLSYIAKWNKKRIRKINEVEFANYSKEEPLRNIQKIKK